MPIRKSKHRLAGRGLVCVGVLTGVFLLAVGWKGTELHSGPALKSSASGSGVATVPVDILIRQLDHERAAVRREAVVRLAELGPAAGAAVPCLMGHLQDPDLLVRAHAARAVCRIGLAPEPVVPILAVLLQPQKPKVCGLSALILGDIGPAAREAVPALRTCLAAASAVIRLHAAEAILKIAAGDSEALHELLVALNDESSDVRYFAVNALGAAGGSNDEAVRGLARALTDDDTNVAAAAAINLSRCDEICQDAEASFQGPDSGAPSAELSQMIADLSHVSAAVRQMAAIRLATALPKTSRAAQALRARLDDPDFVVRLHAARALWTMSGDSAEIVPALVDLLGVANPNVAVAAAFVLGQMGPAAAAALPVLQERLASSDLLDRLVLAGAISCIGPNDRAAPAVLIGGLNDREGDVRYLSAIALGDAPLQHQRRIERALTLARDDRNLRVQAAAAEALEKLHARAKQALAEHDAGRTAAATTTAGASNDADATDAAESIAVKPQASRESRAAVRLRVSPPTTPKEGGDLLADAADESPPAGAISAVADSDVAQTAGLAAEPAFEDDNDDLTAIGSLRATIRIDSDQLPRDLARERFAGEPVYYHGYGTTRGWAQRCFCWDAPAVFFKPLYFEDINLERYGIHFGWAQPPISWYCFFQNCLFLPYKLVAQPPCECLYTLGYERPNNCVPLHCYWTRCSRSWNPWCERCPSCPIHPPCPFAHSEDSVCSDECEN